MGRMHFKLKLCGCCFPLLLVGGCDSINDLMGKSKNPPDEFAVVSRAPLTLPPDFNLRPPGVGGRIAVDRRTNNQARQTVFGNNDQGKNQEQSVDLNKSTGEAALLGRAGVAESNSDIRQQVKIESELKAEESESFIDSLVFWRRKSGVNDEIVDATEEAQRLRQARALGSTRSVEKTGPETYGANRNNPYSAPLETTNNPYNNPVSQQPVSDRYVETPSETVNPYGANPYGALSGDGRGIAAPKTDIVDPHDVTAHKTNKNFVPIRRTNAPSANAPSANAPSANAPSTRTSSDQGTRNAKDPLPLRKALPVDNPRSQPVTDAYNPYAPNPFATNLYTPEPINDSIGNAPPNKAP